MHSEHFTKVKCRVHFLFLFFIFHAVRVSLDHQIRPRTRMTAITAGRTYLQ